MKNIGENIWVVERAFRLLGAEFGNRMTVVKLHDSKLLLHSPVMLDAELKGEMDALGDVKFIITPNNYHGLFAKEWKHAYPAAMHYTAKLHTNYSNMNAQALNSTVLDTFAPEIDALLIDGIPKVNEYVFYHALSKTVIFTDLLFNINTAHSFWTKVFFSLNGAFGKLGPSRLMRAMIEDPAALRRSLEKILEWDFERIVMSHGDIVVADAKSKFRSAFEQYLTHHVKHKRSIALHNPIRCG